MIGANMRRSFIHFWRNCVMDSWQFSWRLILSIVVLFKTHQSSFETLKVIVIWLLFFKLSLGGGVPVELCTICARYVRFEGSFDVVVPLDMFLHFVIEGLVKVLELMHMMRSGILSVLRVVVAVHVFVHSLSHRWQTPMIMVFSLRRCIIIYASVTASS